MSSGPVAVIDLGSNSIKVLVATRTSNGRLSALRQRAIDARISAGISHTRPQLSEEGMQRGLDAVRTLLTEAAVFHPDCTVLVATSAVRDAVNGDEFRTRVKAATGHSLRILSGEEEANLIGRGLTCDPALATLRNFYVFDLGGGSLEGLAFRERRITQAVSLPLGCVRLTERFVADPSQPLDDASAAAIAGQVRTLLPTGSFEFSLPADAIAVGTGGTLTTARAILGACLGQSVEKTDPVITVTQLRELLAWLGGLTLARRKEIAGLPSARADVFPTALATFITVAEIGGLTAFHNSFYNLRWGVAAEALCPP